MPSINIEIYMFCVSLKRLRRYAAHPGILQVHNSALMSSSCFFGLGAQPSTKYIKGVSPSFIKLTSLLNLHSPNYARLYGQLNFIINHIQQRFSLSETQSEPQDPPVENHNTFHSFQHIPPLEGHHLPVSAKSCGQTCRLGW